MAISAEDRIQQLRVKVTGWYGQAKADEMLSRYGIETVRVENGITIRTVPVYGGKIEERNGDSYFYADVEAAPFFEPPA